MGAPPPGPEGRVHRPKEVRFRERRSLRPERAPSSNSKEEEPPSPVRKSEVSPPSPEKAPRGTRPEEEAPLSPEVEPGARRHPSSSRRRRPGRRPKWCGRSKLKSYYNINLRSFALN